MTEAQTRSAASTPDGGPIDRRRFVAEMRRAMQLHDSGKLAEAAAAYARALEHHPDQPEALNYSGYLAHQMGDSAAGLAAIKRSIALAPDNPNFISNLAKLQQAIGRAAEAAQSYRRVLALAPHDAQALYNLGIVLQQQGELREAKSCFERVIEVTPDDPRPYINLGNICKQSGRLNKAARLYLRATELDPNDTAAQNNLAATLKALGKPDKAMQWYRRSLAVAPDSPLALCELGALQSAAGRQDEADAAYRQALQIDPTFGTAYLYLSAGKRFERDDADLAAMEALLSDPEVGEGAAVALHFALGKAYDDLGHYGVAFRQFAEGNRLLRTSLRFDLDATEFAAEKILANFDADLFARNRDAGSDSTTPIFVVGPAQSGKSLVELCLARHPEFGGAQATPELRNLARRLPVLAGVETAFPDCVHDLQPAAWQDLAEHYLQRLAPPANARHTLDGTPNGFRLVGLMHLLFPRAAIVHCRRDPLDAGLDAFCDLSGSGAAFACDLDELGHMQRLYQRCMDHWSALLPGRLFEIDYEELIAEPETNLRRLLDHCGLAWDAACLEPLPAADAARIGAWRNYDAHLAPLKAALGLAR